MQKRHIDLINTLLERVIDIGCDHVLAEELRRWYGVQKIKVVPWRDLEERWQEMTDGEAGQLKSLRGGGGWFLLRGDRIKIISDPDGEE